MPDLDLDLVRDLPRRSTPRRTWGQRAVLGALPVAAAVALLGAVVLWDLSRLAGTIRRVPLSRSLDGAGRGEPAKAPSEPQNFLLVGVDGRDGKRAEEGDRPVLSDTILVLRTDPATASAQLLPLPRDLWVDIPRHGPAKINAAMALGAAEDPVAGGPALLVETIRQNLGIGIDHYVEVDFDGFADIVDHFGGLSLYFPTATRDRHIGVDVAAAGCVHLDGAQALDLARSRYYDAWVDGGWTRDPSSELGRIRRQQLIIRAVLARALDGGTRDPLRLRRVLYDLAGTVALDDTLAVGDLLGLGTAYRGVHLDDVATRTLDVSFGTAGAQDVVRLAPSAANDAVLAAFRGTPPPASPAADAPTTTAGSTAAAAPTTTTAAPPPADDRYRDFTPSLLTPDGTPCAG